jgi:acyl dehydratase
MNSHTDRRNQPGSFDPVGFTVVPPRRFEALRVGEVFRAPSRTLTDAHASAFQTVSADNHPIHYDVEYAGRHGRTAPVVHGLQVLAFTAPGATLFPQYIQGDTGIVTTRATVHNQRGELVLDGEHTYSLKAASADDKERVHWVGSIVA